MSLIHVSNLTFAYEGSYDNIFEEVSFQIDTDWKLGFVGRNGRGKTTFLNLLLGKHEYSGSIAASAKFTYFPYEVPDEKMPAAEILESEMPDLELWKIYRELSLLDVKEEVLYRPFHTLSSGEQTKVLLAALFIRDNQFLLIDEPTNHLDREARNKIAEYLSRKKGFILVSHDRELLDQATDHTLSINKTDIELQKGNFSAWYAQKEVRDRSEMAKNQRLKGDIRRLKEAARQASNWSDQVEKTKRGQRIAGLRPDRGAIGHKAAKMMKRSKHLEERRTIALEEKEKLLKNVESAEKLKLYPLDYHKEKLVTAQSLAIYYGGKTIFQDIGFEICRGDRICLEGKNGSGKSSILKLILGEEISYTGKLSIGSQLKISYVSQETGHLKGRVEEYARNRGIDGTLFKAVLRKMDFERVQFAKRMEDFSGGQKKKVLLAASLCEPAHLYIWDEPLNFIDVLSRIQIEDLILEFKPTLLFVEHDAAFQKRIANKTVYL